jgi:hypothetical protein
MTSPVDFISGPRITSTPGNRANGKIASFTATWCWGQGVRSKEASASPAITRAAILARARPMVLATKGTVRLALGFTSRT